MDYAIDTLINVCLVGFFLVMLVDFLGGLRELWLKSAPPRTSEKGVGTNQILDKESTYSKHTLNEKGITSNDTLGEKQQTHTAPAFEDFWTEPLELTEEACCCHSAIAIPTPQLLLEAALEVTNQPVLTRLSSGELRKLCQSAGIKWRNVSGTKHLSKNEMILALTQLATDLLS